MPTTYKPMDQAIVSAIVGNSTLFVDYQPGNGTKYEVLFIENPKAKSLLPFTAVVVNFRSTMQLMGGWVHYSYVQEKLRCSQGDAEPLALLFAHVTEKWIREEDGE